MAPWCARKSTCNRNTATPELTLERAEEDIGQAVDDALARLAEGRFGHCVECGRKIAVQRLEALPYTAFCINCEHRREQGTRAEKDVAPIIELSKLRMTKESRHSQGADGVLRLPLVVAANGVNFIVIKPGL